MSKRLLRKFAAISKTEELPDGTLKVWGYASSGAEDSDGEVITPDAMKAALPDYMKFGAVREMHQAKAAGTAIEASVEADGRTFFGAHIVDTEAVKKVQTGVYKGFSIGGKVTSRDELKKTTITGIKLVEVSLVDRPANPEAVITIMKAERTEEDDLDDLADLLDGGTVTPAQLIALAKAAKPDPVVEPPVPEVVEKGMGHVAQLALMLKAILVLVKDQQAEAAREGDGSGVPAKLQDWLNAGGALLVEMTGEETAELDEDSDQAQDGYDAPYLYLAERSIALAKSDARLNKAGAALSAKNKKHIQGIHDAAAMLGACPAKSEKHDHADDLAKAADDLTKATAAHAEEMTAIGKAAGAPEGAVLATFVEDLAKTAARVPALDARVKELEAKPAPGKGLLKALGKAQDIGHAVDDAAGLVEPVKKADGQVDNVASMIKQIHAGRA